MGRLFSMSVLWSWPFRAFGYWTIVISSASLGYRFLGRLSFGEMIAIVAAARQGDLARVSTQDFAFSLAAMIAAAAGALWLAHLLFHSIFVWLAIREARARVRVAKTKSDFAAGYDRIYAALADHPLLGHAWVEFDETLIKSDGPIRNTLRPQTFFNSAMLRERLPGLKIMPGIPGYFVGIGLLLTFIGLVIALSKAATATSDVRSAADGSGAAAMQGALRELLQAATFKFSTSIAGLAASIVLSFFFRLFNNGVEASLAAFCEALEDKLDYVAPQSVSLAIVEKLDAQLGELKAINSEEFFARLGQEVAPPIHEAMHVAIAPFAERIGDAVGQMSAHSQTGMEGLLKQFTESVHVGAGAELRELATSLHSMQGALENARVGISGSGEDFARQMKDAAENLNRLVADAGQNLGMSADQNRATLEQMVGALRIAFDEANKKVEENLAGSASGAAARLEGAMGRVLDQLEGQVQNLRGALGGFQDNASELVGETQRKVAEAQSQSVDAIARASANAATALEHGLTDTMSNIRKEVESFVAALHTSGSSLGAQAQAIDVAATRSREAADAFGRSAEAIRVAVDPVTRSNERLAGVTQTMSETLGRSVASLEESQKAASTLAESLKLQSQHMTETWRDYENRFSKVDDDLGKAFELLAVETSKQAELLAQHTKDIDKGLAASVDRLREFLVHLDESAESMQDAAEDLKTSLSSAARQPELVG